MNRKQQASIQKPDLAAALDFGAEMGNQALAASKPARQAPQQATQKKPPTGAKKQVSGLVPEGDVRLTANISEEHHIKLKVAAARQRTTIGELLEQLIDKEL